MLWRISAIVAVNILQVLGEEPVKLRPGQAAIFEQSAIALSKHAVPSEMQCSTMGEFPASFRSALDYGVQNLNDTAEKFGRSDPTPRQMGAARALFRFLKQRYDVVQARKEEPTNCARLLQLGGENLTAHEGVFVAVASTAEITFDLQVSSDPGHSSVSYRRAGEQYRKSPDSTTTTLTGLEYAIWYLLVEHPGYESVERPFDPFREKVKAVHVALHERGNGKD